MATLRQIEASRANGAKSRGPVTADGKARTSLNSAKHGLYSKALVLNNEDPNAYAAMLEAFIDDLNPTGATEIRLVTDIVNANWRIDRLTAYESAALDLETDRMRPDIDAAFEEIDEPTRATLAFNSILANNRTWDAVQAGLRTQYRIRDRALSQLLRLQKDRRTTAASNNPPSAAPATPQQPAPNPATATTQNATKHPVNIENHRSKPEPCTEPPTLTPDTAGEGGEN